MTVPRVLFSSVSVDHPTPKALYAELYAEFAFTLDPCPLGGRDGLVISWAGEHVFCNPPYGPGIPVWLGRRHDAPLVVYLLPARTDTAWFHELVMPDCREIRFLRGRLQFGDHHRRPAPFPSMVVVFSTPLACSRPEWTTRARPDTGRPAVGGTA